MNSVPSPSSKDTQLRGLLGEVGTGQLQLPEFQRGWTWDDGRICAILSTLVQGYPMGAVMLLQCGGEAKFKARPFEGATEADRPPLSLVLDGQQRLTSMYRALCAVEPVETKGEKGRTIRRFYYLDIAKCLDGGADGQDAVVSVPDTRVKKSFSGEVELDLSTPEKEYAAGGDGMFPLNILFNGSARERWGDGWKKARGHDEECEGRYNAFRDRILDKILQYSLPVITLPKETPAIAVCQIFEHVNTGGVSLTVFELVTASFAADNFDLRADWEKEVRPAVHGDGEPLATDVMHAANEKDFLTAVTLFASHERDGATSCSRRDVLELPLEEYRKYRDRVMEGFKLARRFLVSQNVFRMRDLPYAAQLIPLVAVCAAVGESVYNKPKARDVLARWYWCGVLGEAYGGQTETTFVADMDEVPRAMKAAADEKDPVSVRTIDKATFSSGRLLSMQSRNSAAYKGMLALVYRHRCEDFMHGMPMDAAKSMDENPDLHHIFPKRWCVRHGIPQEKRDSIVNKTPILPSTNQSVGGSAPSSYARKIMKATGLEEGELRRRLESHLVDWKAFMDDDFNAHFIARAKRLLDLVEEAMGRKVPDRGAPETVRQFGASLESAPAQDAAAKSGGGAGDSPGGNFPAEDDGTGDSGTEQAGGSGGAAGEEGPAEDVAGNEASLVEDTLRHFKAVPAAGALFRSLHGRVLSLGAVESGRRQRYVWYRTEGKGFLTIAFVRDSLRLTLNAKKGELEDPSGLAVPARQHLGRGDYEAIVRSAEQISAAMDLVRQAHRLVGEKARGRKPRGDPSGEGSGGGPDGGFCADEAEGVAEHGEPSGGMNLVAEEDPAVGEVVGHFKAVPAVAALFRLLHARILGLGSVSFGRGSRYAWYKTGGGEFLSLTFNRDSLRLNLMARLDELDDPLGLACRNDGHLGRSECKIFAGSPEELDGAMDLIRQCFEHAHAEPGRRRSGGFRRRFWTAFCAHAAGKPEMKAAFGFRTPRDDSWYDLSSEADCPGIELAILARSGFVRAALYFKGNGDLCEDFRRQEDVAAALASGEFAWSGTGGEFRLYAERGVDPEDESSWSAAFDWLCAMSLRLKALALKCNEKD